MSKYKGRAVSKIPTNVLDIVYTAGLFDGEGSVGAEIMRKEKRRARYHYYKISARIGMTHKPTIEWMKKVWGGATYFVKPQRRNHKPSYVWCAWSLDALSFFIAIIPFLKTRKKVALVAAKLQKDYYGVGGRHKVLSVSRLKRRHELFMEIKNLNRKGIDARLSKRMEKGLAEIKL